jgi:hypothetical protein
MKEDWVKVFSSMELIQVKLAEDILKQHGIESHILNPTDSAFPGITFIELYTLPEKAEEAIKILEENDIK